MAVSKERRRVLFQTDKRGLAMVVKTFEQEFKGYFLEDDIGSINTNSGVYGVYRCTYSKDKDTVSVKQLIYIGKADNLNERLNGHEKKEDWKGYLQKGEKLCYCYTLISKDDNERVEAALINSNQPPENVEYKNHFPFDKTTVTCEGEHKFIKKTNIVVRH